MVATLHYLIILLCSCRSRGVLQTRLINKVFYISACRRLMWTTLKPCMIMCDVNLFCLTLHTYVMRQITSMMNKSGFALVETLTSDWPATWKIDTCIAFDVIIYITFNVTDDVKLVVAIAERLLWGPVMSEKLTERPWVNYENYPAICTNCLHHAWCFGRIELNVYLLHRLRVCSAYKKRDLVIQEDDVISNVTIVNISPVGERTKF